MIQIEKIEEEKNMPLEGGRWCLGRGEGGWVGGQVLLCYKFFSLQKLPPLSITEEILLNPEKHDQEENNEW